MTSRSFLLSDALEEYVHAHTERPDPIAQALIAETATLPMAGMQIAPDEAALLGLLVRISGARDLVEVGTFTGYSALVMARALPGGGHLLCCDVSEEWTAIARRSWERAGVSDRIELRIGPGLDTLRALPTGEQFDLAFIDADKESYPAYLAELVPRIRSGGLLLADNVLRGGAVVDPANDAAGTRGIRRFNQRAADDPRLETLLLAAFDGLTIARKR